MAFPTWIIPIITAILPWLFGGKRKEEEETETQKQITTQTTPSTTDPGYALLSQWLLGNITPQAEAYLKGGWGGGPQSPLFGMFGKDWTTQLLQMLEKTWGETITKMGEPAVPVSPERTCETIRDDFKRYCDDKRRTKPTFDFVRCMFDAEKIYQKCIERKSATTTSYEEEKF
jgi:hypothetical protein